MANQTQITDTISSGPHTTHDTATCEIRALETAVELYETYRLRYDIYGALGYIQHRNASQLEIDAYDPCSIPFGAFDRASGEMIGTLRLITIEPQPDYEELVRSVLVELDDQALTDQVLGPRPHSLPSIVSDQVDLQIDEFNTERYPVQELSRTIVRPGHRGAGISRGLMELGLAHAMLGGPTVLVGGCLPRHVPMYAKYGYQQLPHSGSEHFDSVGQIASPVVCRTDALPEPTRSHVDQLLDAIGAGAPEHSLEIGRDSRALFRFTPPRRARRRTREW